MSDTRELFNAYCECLVGVEVARISPQKVLLEIIMNRNIMGTIINIYIDILVAFVPQGDSYDSLLIEHPSVSFLWKILNFLATSLYLMGLPRI